MVPNCLLKAFFERLGYDDAEFPWDRLGEREVSPMIKWIGLLPRRGQNAIDSHLRQVFDLACHSGMEALFEAAAMCGDLNMASDMPRDVGLYAKAMWAWLFAYRRDEGSLELFGKVPAHLKRQLEEIFADTVLGVQLGPWDPNACYELDHLKDRSFHLETDPEDQVRARIRRMCLTLKNSGRRIWVEVDVNDPFDNIHRALEECLNKEHVPLSDVMVTRVTFCFDFLPLDGRVPGRVQFDVGRPNTCTLRSERADRVELIAKYLRLWRIDRARRVALALAATGT
jgi:hypothetical protein